VPRPRPEPAAGRIGIGLVISTLAGGGAEYVAEVWARGLAERGHRVRFLTYARHVDPPPPGVALDVFPGTGARERWTTLPGFVREVAERERLDAMLGLLTFSNLAVLRAAGRRRRFATVITEHVMPSLLLPGEGAAGHAKLRLARLLYPRADAAIGVSHAVGVDLVVGLGVARERLRVLPNPVAPPEDGEAPPPPARLRILCVGRQVAYKHPERLLDVAGELTRRGTSAELRFVGDGPQQAALAAEARARGVPAEFTGWLRPWQAAAEGCDCLVLPSDVEGFGNVLVEAAAIGLPVVASSTAFGVADALIPGVTGALALSTRPGDLADAVLEAVALGDTRRSDAAGWLRLLTPARGVDRVERIVVDAVGAWRRRV
jgi:glycosyltransferase involved in cell wall biosynthesis